ncbi:MAG: hypothetical protein KF782_21880 [Labilithrix sp.]|nr:hypothetical protein [Labilithrix sp.]
MRALSARAVSLPDADAREPRPAASRGALELDPRAAIARAIGRCAGPLSEQVLVALLRAPLARSDGAPKSAGWIDPALLGLGDLATRRKQLGADAMTALLDAAGDRSTPRDLAFYALGRAEPGEAFSPRVAEVARLALGRPGPARIHAVRALGRAGKESPKEIAPDLARIVTDAEGFDEGERAEAARALGALGDAGQSAIAGAIAELTPDAKDRSRSRAWPARRSMYSTPCSDSSAKRPRRRPRPRSACSLR